MSIEFRCTGCQKLLRVADDTAGKRAKCPQCGTILEIPAAASPEADEYELEAPSPSPGPADSDNPYQSPLAADASVAPRRPAEPGEIVPTRIDLGEAFSRTWAIFKQEMGLVIGVVVLVFVLNFAAGFVLGFLIELLAPGGALRFLLLRVVPNLISMFLGIGQTMILLDVARGRRASFNSLLAGGPYFLAVLLASILFAFIVAVGFVLLIIPGIILSLMFSQFYYLIIDRNLGVMDSLSVSREVTYGNKWTLLAIGIVAFGMAVLGLLACFVGLLFAVPYVMLLSAVAYLMMTGQPTAVD